MPTPVSETEILNIFSGLHLKRFDIAAIEDDIPSFKIEITAFGHGLPGVDIKV